MTCAIGADSAVSGGALDLFLVSIQRCEINPAVEDWLHENRVVVALVAQVRESRAAKLAPEWIAALLAATVKCVLASMTITQRTESQLLNDFVGPAEGLECIRSTIDWLCNQSAESSEVAIYPLTQSVIYSESTSC